MNKLILIILATSSLTFFAEAETTPTRTVNLVVTEKGFEPNNVDVKAGSDVVLNIVRKTDSTCAKQVQVPSKELKADLPLNKPVILKLGKLEKGEIRFSCGMDMISGVLVVK